MSIENPFSDYALRRSPLERVIPGIFDATVPIQMILSAILRSGEAHPHYDIIDLLLGKETERVLKTNLHKLKTFGVGKDIPWHIWEILKWELHLRRLLKDCYGSYPLRIVSDSNWRRVLKGEDRIIFQIEDLRTAEVKFTCERFQETVSERDPDAKAAGGREMRRGLTPKEKEEAEFCQAVVTGEKSFFVENLVFDWDPDAARLRQLEKENRRKKREEERKKARDPSKSLNLHVLKSI